jgi:hypothetical protein
MRPLYQRLILVGVVLLLLLTPLFVRTVIWQINARPYAVGQVPITSVAATPVPTRTPMALSPDSRLLDRPLRPGPVIVDLAHGNRLQRSQFESLASALARRGVGVRFWLSNVDVMSLTNFLDYPDQSAELGPLLEDASALIVVSPFFLWSREEIALAERFVADGGHLLLISDPDVMGDLAQDINTLAEPFGVVFNDDYLYDTVVNDGNYTYILPNDFNGEAARLDGRTVAFYGARSISGEVTPLLRTAMTTLSSLRTGLTNFTTMALGGLESRSTLGNVLAVSDFDVLSTTYMDRHENRELVEFVAGFLAAAERRDTVTDFPGYLGKEVALIFGNIEAVNAQILLEGSRLQRSLELTGRTLNLAGTTLLTNTLQAGAVGPGLDLIVLADYQMIEAQTDLLKQIGFKRVEVAFEPEPSATSTGLPDVAPGATVTPTSPLSPTLPSDEEDAAAVEADKLALSGPAPGVSAQLSATAPVTVTTPTTPTVTPQVVTMPTAQATATPAPMVFLEKSDGLRLVARQTVIIAQLQLDGQNRLVAVLGHDNAGIQNGVERLLTRDYSGCVTGPDQAICSFEGSVEAEPPAPPQATAQPPITAGPEPSATPEPTVGPMILIVDDNETAAPTDTSEADTYLQAMTQLGYAPTLWTTAEQNLPSLSELQAYQWVIWSSGGYENGGPSVNDLDVMLGYINDGGFLTISSRRPFFAMSTEDPAVIADIVVENDLPALVAGLPADGITLPNGLPPVTPLEINDGLDGPQVALRRGPDSGSPGTPLLFVASDEGTPDATGARLMILGMSLTWLPDGYDIQLAQNMAEVMLEP